MTATAVDRATERRRGLDAEIRSAERAAFAGFGLDPVERSIAVDTGYGTTEVRLLELGGSGTGRPVLLLHGVASVNVIAAPLIRALGDRRVVAVDWPGHGLSGPCVLPEGANLREHACAVIEGVMDALDLPEVDLVGHSLGAQFSLYAALGLRHRISRVVLLGAPGAALSGVRPVTAMKLMAIPGLGPTVLSLPLSEATFRRTTDQMLGTGSATASGPAVERAAYLLGGRTSNAHSIASFFRALLRHGKVRPGLALRPEELASIRQPVLMVWGDLDVFQTPLSAAASIAAVRDIRLRRLAAAGHAPWLQQEQAASEAIRSHLA